MRRSILAAGVAVLMMAMAFQWKLPADELSGLGSLSETAKATTIGALWCFKCPTTNNKTCPGAASCVGATCTAGVFLCFPNGGTSGCTVTGGYTRCKFSLFSTCTNNVTYCGTQSFPSCVVNALGICTGACVVAVNPIVCRMGC